MNSEAGLARCVIASWLDTGADSYSQCEAELALSHVPDDIILSTRKDDRARMLFLGRFTDAMVAFSRAVPEAAMANCAGGIH